jgi:hypothetical protein
MVLSSVIDVATIKPELEIADIFRLHFDDYLQTHHCTPEEFAAVNAIIRCRTAALGGHVRVCDACGRLQIAYNSCNNRNCPKCGSFEKAQWLSEQGVRLFAIPHFHGVFTVDHLVNPLASVNPTEIYDLLFRTVNRVLKQFAAKYLGGAIGVTAVLHTWGQTMQQHIHLHCLITGGALVETADGYVWRGSAAGFLLPVVELSAAFRDAFCKGLRRLHGQKKLRLVGECAEVDVEQLVNQMQGKKWEVYLGAPPENAQLSHLLSYLGRYVHRTAITNQRLRNIEDGQVTFEYYNNRERDAEGKGAKRVMTLPATEFIRRFLQHVLPFQYKRVRHYGLYASGNKLWRQAVRLLLGESFEPAQAPRLQLGEWLQSLGIEDALRCPFCQQGSMRLGRDFAPLRGYVLWLLFLLGVPVFGKEART